MRVLHCITSIDPRAGGPAIAVAGLARAQAATGMDLHIVATYRAGADDSLAEQLRSQSVRVDQIGPCHGPLHRHPELNGAVRKAVMNADVVHIHGLWEEIQHQAAMVSLRSGKPYVVRPCGMLDPWSLNQSRWKKRLYMAWRLRKHLDRAAAIHFTSDLERDLAGPLKLKAPPIVEPNGVDLAEFENLPPVGTFRAGHPRLEGRPFVLFLSRIHHKKGLDLLIPAFARTDPKTMLVIAGPDSDGYQAKVEEMIRRHHIEDRVIFTGMLRGAERVAALRDADLFALPSYQENFGIAVVEALAAGTPVIISDQVNIHDEIAAGEVGGVIPTQVGPLADELNRWLGDPSRRRAAAELARPFVWERYDWNVIAKRWIVHYRNIDAAWKMRQT